MEDLKIFKECFQFEPNSMQREFCKCFHEFDILILKSLTASGKTEAALVPSLVEGRKTIYLLPTRSLIEDQQNRFRKYMAKLSETERSFRTLAVDMGNYTRWFVFKDGNESFAKWYHLYNADVILSTYEKFESRLLGYGAVKSYAYPYKLFIANEPFSIIIDEFHLISDSVARLTVLKCLASLAFDYNNLKLVFMSATSPRWLVNFLLEEAKSSYRIIDFIDDEQKLKSLLNDAYYGKERQLYLYFEEEEISNKLHSDFFKSLLTEISGKQVIIKTHSVKKINELFERLAKYCERPLLYHGNLADEVRCEIYNRIKQFNDQEIPFTLFTTHAIEVGCDIDADILILELCEPSSLIQSLGRLNRRLKRKGAKLYIFGTEFPKVQKEKIIPTFSEEILKQTKKILRDSLGTCDKIDIIFRIRNIMNSELYQESIRKSFKKDIFNYFKDVLRMISLSPLLDKKSARPIWDDWKDGIMLGSDAWPLVQVEAKLDGKPYTITVSMEDMLGHDDCRKVNLKILVPNKDSREEAGPGYSYDIEKGISGIYVEVKDDFIHHFIKTRIINGIKVIDFVNIPKVLDCHIHDDRRIEYMATSVHQKIYEITYCGKRILKFKQVLEY